MFIIALLFFFSCTDTTLLQRSEERMPIALDKKIIEEFGEYKHIDVRDVKMVYTNDSICLLQCRVNLIDKKGNKQMLEYRYIYLIDVIMSRFTGKVIYNECVMDFPCMPDDLIKKCQEEVVLRNESVYNDLYPRTSPIKE